MIEQELFKKCTFDTKKLLSFGFIQEKDILIYHTTILNDSFEVVIKVEKNEITGKILDKSFDLEEYTAFRRQDVIGSYAGTVKEEYEKVLNNIKKKCCTETLFQSDQSNRIVSLIKEKYDDNPIFKWDDLEAGVFENKINHKWYGLLMPVDKSKLDNKTEKSVDVLNIKLDPDEILNLLEKDGFYKAYHMNKKYWISMILDNTIKDEEIMSLIDKSYKLVEPKSKK